MVRRQGTGPVSLRGHGTHTLETLGSLFTDRLRCLRKCRSFKNRSQEQQQVAWLGYDESVVRRRSGCRRRLLRLYCRGGVGATLQPFRSETSARSNPNSSKCVILTRRDADNEVNLYNLINRPALGAHVNNDAIICLMQGGQNSKGSRNRSDFRAHFRRFAFWVLIKHFRAEREAHLGEPIEFRAAPNPSHFRNCLLSIRGVSILSPSLICLCAFEGGT